MPFSLSGGVITQSGIDTDLSGLAGIAGVSVSDSASIVRYSFADMVLNIDGELSIVNEESLRISGGEGNSIVINSGGHLRLASETILTRDGNPLPVRNGMASIELLKNTATRPFRNENRGMRVRSGGSFTMVGSVIISNQSIYFEDGSNNIIEDGIFYFSSDINYQNFIIDSAGTSIDGITLIDTDGSKLGIGIQRDLLRLNGFTPIGVSLVGHVGTGTELLTNLTDYVAGSATRADINLWNRNDDPIFRINGSNIGNSLNVTGTGQQSSARGYVEHEIRFYPRLRDLSGAAIEGARYYMVDSDNGNRSLAHETVGRLYSLVSDSSGNVPVTQILTGVWHNGGNPDLRSRYEFDDRLPVSGQIASYGQAITAVSISSSTLADQNGDITLLPDFNISNLDQSIVAAYSNIINAQTFYDYAKLYLIDNYAGESNPIVTRNNNTLDAGSYDVIIDASATSVFAFDGSTITIRSNSYSGLITTTGTVTLVNGAVQSGGIIDVNGILVGVSSDAMFNIIARHSAMAAGVYYPYQENVDNAAFTVPAGETLEIAMWQLGKQVLYQRIDPAATPSFNARFIDHPFVDANIDVTTILDTIDVALSPTQYSVTFNAPIDINIEQVKTVLHHIFGQAPSLIASLSAGEGPRAIEIRTSEIAINSPIIKALRGPGLTTSQDVTLRAFFNNTNALALDPNYTLTPQDANNMRVQTLIEKPQLDPSQLANAVWDNQNGVATLGHARAANIQTQK